MAEYIRFRFTAAKVGVTMALAALIAGIAERAHSVPTRVNATQAGFLKIKSLNGTVASDFAKIEKKFTSIDSVLAKIEKKVRTDLYTKAETAKIYLKDAAANAEFLKKADTAANSAKLGNLASSAYVHGNNASVITGATTIGAGDSPQTLLQIPSATNGGIIVVCEPVPGGGSEAVLRNQTGVAIPAVQDGTAKSLSPGDNTIITGNLPQATLQLFPTTGFSQVVTLVVSLEVNGDGKTAFVGQAFTGGT